MTERHLILQELTLLPSAEWTPRNHSWLMARVSEGVGYWMQHGVPTRELSAGDGFIVGHNSAGILRASQLSPLKLQFFIIQPQHLNGLLAVTEWHQLEVAPNNLSSYVSVFTAAEPTGQKFARISHQTPCDKLPMRCALLQLWVNAVAELLPPPLPAAGPENKLRERFRRLVGRMTEAELSECSLAELAGELHCSERHFSRLFREEFGVPLRARQIELRLQRARQLLAETEAKIINVAYDSGYRHLGLFNTMFKKRFGMTPGEWRLQNGRKSSSLPVRPALSRAITGIVALLLLSGIFFLGPRCRGQTDPVDPSATEASFMTEARMALMQKMSDLDEADRQPKFHIVPATTNGPHFGVSKYLVIGNSVLEPETIGSIVTNVPSAFGTNVSFEDVRAMLGDLQMAYRERGFVTVSVGLPQQKLTNAEVKVKVTEGVLAAINVVDNRYYSSNNVMRALPSLHTNLLLNSHVFQRELDAANANRDRQIYPVIAPGMEPGTTELTLKVKDRFPLHGRIEINNQATPNTPAWRINSSLQYDNLWDQEHQVGLQYNFDLEKYRGNGIYSETPLDSPLVANYSGYYRLPLGGYNSVQEQLDNDPGRLGYDEVTHQFNLPAPTGRPELTFYAARSVTDTGVQRGSRGFLADETATNSSGVVYHPLSITTNSAGQNITLNENLGLKFSLPLALTEQIAGNFSFGADFKRFRQTGFNTNENFFEIQFFDSLGNLHVNDAAAPQPQPAISSGVDYFPLNAGFSFAVPDKLGTTFFSARTDFNVFQVFSEKSEPTTTTNITATSTNIVTNTRIVHGHSFSDVAYTTNAAPHYVTMKLNIDRVQTIYGDWSVKLHADGQWADGPLFGNEQYGVAGSGGVRGYTDGDAYGDEGWRLSIEPQTRPFDIGMIGNEGHMERCWLRGSIFLDYGEAYRYVATGGTHHLRFCGAGWSLTANLGSHLDGRLTVACPLISNPLSVSHTRAGDVHVYFGVGAQF